MSILNQQDELKVFACPACGKTISTVAENCRHCGLLITNEAKSVAVERQDEENRQHHIGLHKSMITIGVVLFLVGLALLAQGVLSIVFGGRGRFSLWSPILTLVGLGQIIYGLLGIRRERKQ